MAVDASAVARAIAYAIEQPKDVDTNEIILRPPRPSRRTETFDENGAGSLRTARPRFA